MARTLWKPVVSVPVEVVQSDRLSLAARGLYCLLQSYESGEAISDKELMCASPQDTIESIASALKELTALGYLKPAYERDGDVWTLA